PAGAVQQVLPARLLRLAPQRARATRDRHERRVLETGDAEQPRDAVRPALVVPGLVLLERDDVGAPRGELPRRARPDRTETHHRDLRVQTHAPIVAAPRAAQAPRPPRPRSCARVEVVPGPARPRQGGTISPDADRPRAGRASGEVVEV